MRRVLIVVVAMLLATPAMAQTPLLDFLAGTPPIEAPAQPQKQRVVLPFENLGPYDELPDYVYSMPRAVYQKWVKMQNAGAYRQAQRMADDFAARHPLIDTYVQDSDYVTTVDQEQHEEVDHNSADFSGRQSTRYAGQNKQRTYRDQRWGGGPVLLLNPYTPRPPKVIFKDGLAFVADPDEQIETEEEAMKLLEEATK